MNWIFLIEEMKCKISIFKMFLINFGLFEKLLFGTKVQHGWMEIFLRNTKRKESTMIDILI